MFQQIKFWICENITGHNYVKVTPKFWYCERCGVSPRVNLTKRK